ncbi:MAG: hypothetical protein RIN56_14265 [Sporomusaceae bacterium]|nr:hypothetical protein [Sporomusaceae bacterium]
MDIVTFLHKLIGKGFDSTTIKLLFPEIKTMLICRKSLSIQPQLFFPGAGKVFAKKAEYYGGE